MKRIDGTDYSVYCIGDQRYLLKGKATKRFLLLPIEDSAAIAKCALVVNNQKEEELNVRLAVKEAEYYVPLDIAAYQGKQINLVVDGVVNEAVCWDHLKEANEYDRTNREKFKPLYHFTPDYGWMNDPNGMVYYAGTYHFSFQYNPYGSTWENMSWGHAETKDLVRWTHEPDVLHGDGFGGIFSGGAVVDHLNSAGFGKDALIAFYTNAGIGQMQCIAYSLDNGKSFTKYQNNPILTSEVADFRDPKVFYHEDTQRWIMILAVDQHMEIYSSSNLLDWTYESSFGKGEGAHGGVWECPDLVELPVECTHESRWVLICNINPGGPFGGSATQYFVGSFDGKKFVNDSPTVTKWMDFGKDFYATVTWANAPENRKIALAWMSNWQYANEVPTKQFRSATTLPRELMLFRENKEVYLKNYVVEEIYTTLGECGIEENILVQPEYEFKNLFQENSGAYYLNIHLMNKTADEFGFVLFNDKNESVTFTVDIHKREFTMDRAKSGIVKFDPSNTFTNKTTAPLMGFLDEIELEVWVDRCSIEVIGNGGKFTMTNLVFPQEAYNHIRFYSRGGACVIPSFQKQPIVLD